MKRLIFIFLISLGQMAHAKGWRGFWSAAGNTWYEKWDATLKQSESFTDDDRMNMLGRALQIGNLRDLTSYHMDIFKRAQMTLLSTPGHAKYYHDKIESLRAEVLANAKIPEAEIIRMQQDGKQPIHVGDYNDFRKEAFPILGLLPSSEAVAVLGHFLNDLEGRDGKDMLGYPWRSSEVVPYPPNCGAAWIAISNLGIEQPPSRNKPEKSTYFFELSEVDAWKDWWNEVKDGKRTYRFIGSSIDYGPDGPVSKEQLQKIERDRKREGERAAGHKKSSGTVSETPPEAAKASKPMSIVGILAACALVGAAVWHFVRSRKRRIS